MRENLFKAKRTDNKEWVEGYPFPSISGKELNRMTVFEPFPGGTVVNTYQIDPETVCQHIGLTDKNGTKAFESDKIYDPHENRVFTIYWDKETAAFCLWDDNGRMKKDISRLSYCAIIGNIHDKEE